MRRLTLAGLMALIAGSASALEIHLIQGTQYNTIATVCLRGRECEEWTHRHEPESAEICDANLAARRLELSQLLLSSRIAPLVQGADVECRPVGEDA